MERRMARASVPIARLEASGVGYVAFAIRNPALFRLMFGGDEQELSANAPLTKARAASYRVLEEAVAKTSPDEKASAIVCLRLWSLVHGIAKLILEGCIKPADYGLTSGEALAVRLLRPGE